MKKTLTLILTVLLAISFVFGFSSCDDDKEYDGPADGTVVENEDGTLSRTLIGLTFRLTPDFEERNYSGYTHSYTNGPADFLVAAMSYQQLEEATYDEMPDPWPTNVYDYSRHFVIINNIGLKYWSYDEANNIATIKHVFKYTGEDAGMLEDEYVHYVIMDNGEAIFFITYSCEISERETYEPLFNYWSSLLHLRKVK